MTEYPDLSPYEYLPGESPVAMVNVGWLGPRSPFETGDMDPGFRHALLELIADRPAHRTRGFHGCELCPRTEPVRIPFGEPGSVLLGSAEVHVAGADGVVHAAPNLVHHYVTEHGYRPPQQFVDAVFHAAARLGESRGK